MNIKASLDNSELQLNRLTALYTRAFECPIPISPEEEQRIIEEVMVIQQKIFAYDKYRSSFYPQDIKESLKIEVPQENIANYPVKLEQQPSYQGSQYSMNSAMSRPEMIPIPSSNGSTYSPNQYLMHRNASVSSKGGDNIRQHSLQPGNSMHSNASGSSSGYETARHYSSGMSIFLKIRISPCYRQLSQIRQNCRHRPAAAQQVLRRAWCRIYPRPFIFRAI